MAMALTPGGWSRTGFDGRETFPVDLGFHVAGNGCEASVQGQFRASKEHDHA